MNRFLKEALNYKAMGFSVIPLRPQGKKPLLAGWRPYQKQQATEEELQKWWQRWPDANIGIVTGKVSGIVALDVDAPEGIKTLEERGLSRPPTLASRTGGGGWHYLYKWPGFECRNFAGKKGQTILPSVDFRGDGGYIVAPPSVHESGNRYEWALSLAEAPLAEAPAWLLELIKKQAQSGGRISPEDWKTDIPRGGRNSGLTERVGSLLAAKVPPGEALTMLLAWNQAHCKPPLKTHEVKTIVDSIAKRERNKTGAWPEPEPIEPALLPVEPLHSSLIPGPLRQWVLDVAHRMQCPSDFVAVGAIVVAGSLIGAGCGIRPKAKDDWLVIPNLWGGIVARPSMLKTPALAEAMKPLKRLEAEALQEYEGSLLLAEADQEVTRAAREAIKKEMLKVAMGKGAPGKALSDLKIEYAAIQEAEQPTRRRYLTNDATIEKMAELLNENPRGILYFRDELVGFLVNLDREDRQPDRAFYLEAWNGFGSYTTDRIGRGTIDTNNLCVNILGGIQPSRLTGYLLQAKDDLQNDGLLQRFQLLVYPDEPLNWKLIDDYPDKEARERASRVFKNLADMDFAEYGAKQPEGQERPYFHFSDDAQEVFNSWLIELQARLRAEENPLMVEHLSKYRSLIPSLALIFHLIDIANGQADGPVNADAALVAVSWGEYLKTHARRVYNLAGDPSQHAASELAKRIKQGRLKDGFTIRDAYRKGWYLLNKENVELACTELVAAGWLKENRQAAGDKGGRPTSTFIINPQIRPS